MKITFKFYSHTAHCTIQNQPMKYPRISFNIVLDMKRKNKIWIRFQAFQVTIIQFIMKYRQPVSIVEPFQPFQACTQM